MIICSCNVLTDYDVAEAAREGATRARDVYAVRGCKPQCGACILVMQDVLRELAEAGACQIEGQPYRARQPARVTHEGCGHCLTLSENQLT
ncbi:MAG: (2Fe-2S)-binding protein [Acetobacteraceae bacterium]